MTPSQRNRLARPVVLVYWLLALGGLLVYSAGRLDHATGLAPLWVGAIAGTALGQFLAIRDLRLWLVLIIVMIATYFTMPLMAAGFADLALWKVFIPAALCGFWSLGDRAVLTAFWFPAVPWMLSILDRTDGKLSPDGTGLVLLGALALVFFLFLRVRESRRVGLWSVVSPLPLAPERPAAVLKEPPGRQLARAGWGITVTALTTVLTAWIAPRLWQLESLRGDQVEVPDLTASLGLPCCPSARHAETSRARVKEYLDLGLGHDDGVLPPDDGISCVVCDDPPDGVVLGEGNGGWQPPPSGNGPRGDRVADVIDDPRGGRSAAGTTRPTAAPPGEPVVRTAAPIDSEPPPPAPVADDPAPSPPTPSPELAHPTPAPDVPATQAPEPPAPPIPHKRAPLPPAQPHVATSSGNASLPGSQHRRAAPPHTTAIWPWLAALASGVLICQLVVLGLRPVRRLVTLRHLRRPFWPETIDQRVSNAWQLALVGLRDAGWRPDAAEAPRELAARVKIDGVERCAVILERARHGLGLDDGDLADMQTAAGEAYASARDQLGPTARAVSWLRWPLT